MNAREAFEAWAPPGGPWSAWVKPMLFAHLDEATLSSPWTRPAWIRPEVLTVPEAETGYRTTSRRRVAVVVDAPGVEGIEAGVALHEVGYQPVPLFSSLPGPAAVVPMAEVLAGLVSGAYALRRRGGSGERLPAFLLDSRRGGHATPPRAGQFDNRSVSFPSDFPSGERLRDAGIDLVMLAQVGGTEPRPDLARTLIAWQRVGLAVYAVRTDFPDAPRSIRVRTPGPLTALRLWWERARLRGGAKRGFGGLVPDGGQGG